MMIFGFANTEEALEFGKSCSHKQARQLKVAYSLLLSYSRAALKREELDLALRYAVQAQFVREALQAKEVHDAEETTARV